MSTFYQLTLILSWSRQIKMQSAMYIYVTKGKKCLTSLPRKDTGLHSSAYQPGLRHQTSLFSKLKDKFKYKVLGIIQLPTNKDIYQ